MNRLYLITMPELSATTLVEFNNILNIGARAFSDGRPFTVELLGTDTVVVKADELLRLQAKAGAVELGEWNQRLGYQSIDGRDCEITLEARPPYCDRGAFLAKLHPRGQLNLEIDQDDLWPRFYFSEHTAKAEVVAWLKKRGQYVEPVAKEAAA